MANRVTVLRDGKYVCTRETSELSTDEMVDLMTGESDHQNRVSEHAVLRHRKRSLCGSTDSPGPASCKMFRSRFVMANDLALLGWSARAEQNCCG